jgi:hypothetical protein
MSTIRTKFSLGDLRLQRNLLLVNDIFLNPGGIAHNPIGQWAVSKSYHQV